MQRLLYYLPPERSVGYPTWVSLEDKLPIPSPFRTRKLIAGDNQAARFQTTRQSVEGIDLRSPL